VARLWRELVKDKSYRAYPLGLEAGHYLRAKGKSLTPSSYRDYESCLHKLAMHFCDLELRDLEPPMGTERIEELLEHYWGRRAPRTYNKNHSILSDFFLFQVRRGRMVGNPMLTIDKAKARGVERTTFTRADRDAIFATNPDRSDRLALRLLLDYGIRKGALQLIRFEHFNHERRTLTIFTKGGAIRPLRIPQPGFWLELESLILERDARSDHYLLYRTKAVPHGRKGEPRRIDTVRFVDEPKGVHGMHNWWYGCLERAGIVEPGETSGQKMHKARHTAGQRLLDKTGNLKAVQKLLGHSSISTTGDIYTDWDVEQLAESLVEAVQDE